MRRYNWAYLMARLPIGMSMFGHGLARLPKLNSFSNGMQLAFSKSFLPNWVVLPFSYVLPFAELLTGILLLLGLGTRFALFLGSVIMLILIFGSTTIEQWDNVALQLFYGVYFAGLFLFIEHNRFSIDGLRAAHH